MKLTLTILLSCFLALAGCKTMFNGHQEETRVASNLDYSEVGVTTNGVGQKTSFNGVDINPVVNKHDISTQTYYFDFDNSKVHDEDRPAIEAQAKFLVSHQNARVLLEGHTDSIGSREYNVALGERRADVIERSLKLLGVNTKQIRITSYGQEKPAVLGHTDEAYRLNRRVHLVYEEIS